jgi:hypothetical protein
MRKSQNLSLDKSVELLNAIGGEPVAGSGFETEEHERGFAADEMLTMQSIHAEGR